MKYHKLKAGETTGTYVMESPVTEADILRMAQQLAMSRLSKGRALTDPKQVFSHLQTLLQYHEHEVFALLLLDTKHRVISFRELFRGTLDGASVYPREVVKIALEHNAAAVILVHNHPSGDPEPSQADRSLTCTLREALNLIGVRTLDHIIIGSDGCASLTEQGDLSGSEYEETATDLCCRVHICRHPNRLHGSATAIDPHGALSAAADCSSTQLLDLQPATERFRQKI